jgi:hypothetical protein
MSDNKGDGLYHMFQCVAGAVPGVQVAVAGGGKIRGVEVAVGAAVADVGGVDGADGGLRAMSAVHVT